MICQRCGKETNSHKMSWFNTQLICPKCQKEEEKLPEYQYAKEMERQQVLAGNYNYQGIGYPR